jgi:hypothetical protein
MARSFGAIRAGLGRSTSSLSQVDSVVGGIPPTELARRCWPASPVIDLESREVSQTLNARKKEICTSPDLGNAGRPVTLLRIGSPRDCHAKCTILVADDRVSFGAQFVKIRIIDPGILQFS